MNKIKWIGGAIAGLAGILALGVNIACAAPIFPDNGSTSTRLTLTIYDAASKDITDTWLPEWSPGGSVQTVDIFINDTKNSLTTDLSSVSLTATTYHGNCTNYGDYNNISPDFTLTSSSVVGRFQLTSNDCGGKAVINVLLTDGTNATFTLPRDSNGNGLPDAWENLYGGNLGRADADADASANNTSPGDGISNFDEYRGFIVSGIHVRTNPTQKDLFMHLVKAQCIDSGVSLLGGGTPDYAQGSTLFTNVINLVGTQIHILGDSNVVPSGAYIGSKPRSDEWLDHLIRYNDAEGLVLDNNPTATTATEEDRQINKNAEYHITDTKTGKYIQKGLRITECLDLTATSPLGNAGLGSPNGLDNSFLWTKRIESYINNLITAGSRYPLKYSSYTNGAWTSPVAIDSATLITKAMEYYLAMEIGHSVQLTPTVEGTNKVSYGYHHAPGSGSNLDQAIKNVSSSSGNVFYIPLYYNSSDLTNFHIHN